MADDYGKIKKSLMNVYRNGRFKLQFLGMPVANGKDGNTIIYNWILSGNPGMVGRLGAVESRYVYARMVGKVPTDKNINNLNICAGVFPIKKESLDNFYNEYTKALSKIDIFVAWSVQGGGAIYRHYCPNAERVDFFALEPFFYETPWTAALENRKVLVVHPFVDSIESQYIKRELLFKDSKVIPKFKSLSLVKAVQSNAGNKTKLDSWMTALEYMKNQIKQIDFDVAIIGAGAYGLPLAAYVKSLGKQAVHMAGVTQLLFGIRGRRWDNDSIYQPFFNEHWVHPCEKERPLKSNLVEGGTYW